MAPVLAEAEKAGKRQRLIEQVRDVMRGRALQARQPPCAPTERGGYRIGARWRKDTQRSRGRASIPLFIIYRVIRWFLTPPRQTSSHRTLGRVGPRARASGG